MLRESPCIVVVGAGTGVGKTHVSCALVAELRRRGVAIEARKPVESGYADVESDAERLAMAAGHATFRPRYAFVEAASPHRAARRAGVRIELTELLAWCPRSGGWLIETAGGLLSPLSESLSNLDFTAALEPAAVVLVVANRLGALHDVRACQLALATRELTAQVVLSEPANGDEATLTNSEELAQLGWAATSIEFPRAFLDDSKTKAAASGLADALSQGG